MKILIGSCGGLTGVYLSKLLKKELPKAKIYGFYMSEKIPTKFFLDKFFIMPSSDNEELFLENLILILNTENIDIYIPVHSKEIKVVSKHTKILTERTKAKFVVSPYETFEILDNKRNAYQKLKKIGIDVPKMYNKVEEIDNYPVFIKPEVGSGSKGARIIHSKEELSYIKNQKNFLIMEFLKGNEITVDALFDLKGHLLGFNQRKRIKTLGGAAVITETDFSIDISYILKKIEKNFTIVGPANFQFFYTKDRIVLTDINLRFASGGLPLTVESGFNIPLLTIKLALEENIDPALCKVDRRKRIMYRYFEEIFEEVE